MSSEDNNSRAGTTFDQHIARIAVGAYDDAQDVRTSLMNRIRDVVRKKNEDIPFDEVEDEKEDPDYDAKYQDDNLPDLIEAMREEGKLTDHEFQYLKELLDATNAASKVEERYKAVMEITEAEPIYTEWIDHVYGVSTILTARLIHKFGYCEDFDRVSQLWSYSGFAPGNDKRERGEQLGFDPQAKTLGWLIADRIVMQGDSSRYRTEFYDPYKEQQLHRMELAEDGTCLICEQEPAMSAQDPTKEFKEEGPEGLDWDQDVCPSCYMDADGGVPSAPESRGHADARAKRYLAKKFLKHYWAIARDMRGLEVPDEWVITHGGHDKREDTWENPFYAKRWLND